MQFMTIFKINPEKLSPHKHCAGVAQLVECQLPKLNVAGSNPVSRSNHMIPFYFSLSAIRILFTRRSFCFTQNSDIKIFIIFKLNHRIGKISFA